MAKYTYRFNFRPLTDFTGITDWLEKMAARGWMLDSIGTDLWKFRKIEPRQVHFSAVYLPIDCNLFSSVLPPEAEELQELCAGTGWYWVASMYQMQIFANEESDPTPLETDPVAQIESIHRTMNQNVLPGRVLLLLFVGVLALLVWSFLFAGPLYSEIGFGLLFAAFIFTALLLLEIGDLAGYYLWHKQAAADAQTGVLRSTRSFPGLIAIFLIVLMGTFVLWVGTLPWESQLSALSNMCLFFLVRGAAGIARKSKNLESFVNIGVMVFLVLWAMIFPFVSVAVVNQIEASQHQPPVSVEVDDMEFILSQDEIPLRTEDLISVNPEHQSYQCYTDSYFPCRITRNIQSQLNGGTGTPRLYYIIWDYPLPLYRDYFLSQAMNEEYYPTHVELDPEIWEAQAVYRLCQNGEPQNVYIICWDGRIVSLSLRLDTPNPELTAEQIQIIVEKLKP